MAHLLRVPEISAGATEAVLAAWPVAENSPFSATDVIATVETAKAAIDIEAPESGVILRRLVPEGADVAVGQPIALIGAPGESAENIEAELRAYGITPATPEAATPEAAKPEAATPEAATPEAATPEAATPSAAAARAPARPAAPASTNGASERTFVSPLARRLARAAGLDLRTISGTGPNGRIMRRDVERTARAATPDRTETQPDQAGTEPGPADYTDVPHSRARRAIASRLTESKQAVPHFYVNGSARTGKLLRLRAELNEGAGQAQISLTDLVLKAVARAHLLVPAMNVIWTPDAIRSFASVDVGVAIASPRGLVTPVLRGVDRSGIAAVSASVRDLVERAGSGRLAPAELEGGTTTVTNLGMFGTEKFTAIINPPQSSILAVGAAHRAPVVRKGHLAVGWVMEVTLSVDHRAVDGAVAAEWMRAFVSVIQHPAQILL